MIVTLLIAIIGLVNESDASPETYQARTEVTYCEGEKETGEKISARCSYPDYHCYCINRPHDYPSCQCSRETPHRTTTHPTYTTEEETTWKPLFVLGIGGGVLIVVILTSIACCCMCRHWYSQHPRAVPDKPPEYSDSPPPPYVHSSFYNTNSNRPRTVHRISRHAHSSRAVTRNVSSAILQHSSRHSVPVGMVSCQSEQNMRSMRDMQDMQSMQDMHSMQSMQHVRSNPVARTEENFRTLSRGDVDRVRLPGGTFLSDDIAIVDLEDV